MADRPTDSQRGCLWRIPTEEVSLSELSGTVMCIRLRRRPLQRESGWGCVCLSGRDIRDSLAVYFFSDYCSSKPFVFLDSDGQVETAPASLTDSRTAHTVPTPSSHHHLFFVGGFFFSPVVRGKSLAAELVPFPSAVYAVRGVVFSVISSRLCITADGDIQLVASQAVLA